MNEQLVERMNAGITGAFYYRHVRPLNGQKLPEAESLPKLISMG